jgi:hypothetical protein
MLRNRSELFKKTVPGNLHSRELIGSIFLRGVI